MRQSAQLRFPAAFHSIVLILALAAGLAAPEGSHACRFWALVGAGYPGGLIEDQLRSGTISNLETLGTWNANGWAFAAYPRPLPDLPLHGPLIRRGGPPASHPVDPDYDRAVNELIALRPRCALGHVRAASSGLRGIPDPHPFEHAGLVFAHNGSLPAGELVDILLDADPAFFDTHPPDYLEEAIDSEIYFLYLIRSMEVHADRSRTDAIVLGVRDLALRFPTSRLNFAMSQGDTLWALRCAPYDDWDPVRYFPAATPGESDAVGSPYWCVASEIVGSTEEGWGAIPARHLGVFVPGRPAQFLPVEPTAPPRDDPEMDPAVRRSRIQTGEAPR